MTVIFICQSQQQKNELNKHTIRHDNQAETALTEAKIKRRNISRNKKYKMKKDSNQQ